MYKIKRFSKSERHIRKEDEEWSFNRSLDDSVSKLNKGQKIGRSSVGAVSGVGVGLIPSIASNKPSGKTALIHSAIGSSVGAGVGYLSGRKVSKENLSKAEIIKKKFKSANKKTREEMKDDLSRGYRKPHSNEFKDNLNKWSKED